MSDINALLRFYKGRKSITIKRIEEFQAIYAKVTESFEAAQYGESPMPRGDLPINDYIRNKAHIKAKDIASGMFDIEKNYHHWYNLYTETYHEELAKMMFSKGK